MLGKPRLGAFSFGTTESVSVPLGRGSSLGFQRGAKSESAGARSGLKLLPGSAGGEASFNDVASWVLFANGLIEEGTFPDSEWPAASVVGNVCTAVDAPDDEGVERSISTIGIRFKGTILDALGSLVTPTLAEFPVEGGFDDGEFNVGWRIASGSYPAPGGKTGLVSPALGSTCEFAPTPEPVYGRPKFDGTVDGTDGDGPKVDGLTVVVGTEEGAT